MMSVDITERNKEEILSCIRDGSIDEADLLELVSDNDYDIAFAVANCKYSTEPILDIAAHDQDERIRLAVVNNDSCSVRTLQYLEKDGLRMDDSEEGLTGYKGHEHLHVNMIGLNYYKIGLVLKMLNEVFQKSTYTPKIDKQTAKEYIMEVHQAGLLNIESVQESLRKDIIKYCEIIV